MSDSRAVLLAAAAEVFARNGLKGTRVQEIVQAAGVNERMIYHHFGNKDGLYRAVIEEQRTQLAMAWRPVVDKALGMAPYPGLRLLFSGFFDAVQARPQVAALLLHEALGDTELAVPAGADQFLASIRALYERGQAEGVFTATPFPIAYMTVTSALVAVTVVAPRFGVIAEPGLAVEPDQLREQVISQLLDGMTG
jgi:AcrR family transcriptional regulator